MGSGDGRSRHLGLIAFAYIVVPNNVRNGLVGSCGRMVGKPEVGRLVRNSSAMAMPGTVDFWAVRAETGAE